MPPPDPSVVRIDGPWRHLQVHANGIRFHVVEGESSQPDQYRVGESPQPASDRPLVILLHGSVDGTATYLQRLADRGVISADAAAFGGQFGVLLLCVVCALALALLTRGRLGYPRYQDDAERLDLDTPPAADRTAA